MLIGDKVKETIKNQFIQGTVDHDNGVRFCKVQWDFQAEEWHELAYIAANGSDAQWTIDREEKPQM